MALEYNLPLAQNDNEQWNAITRKKEQDETKNITTKPLGKNH